MPGQVERWLESFMCAQYAETFENFGYRTLQLVCQLQSNHLQSMCIPHKYWDVILQNVQILRQSLGGSGSQGSGHYSGGDVNAGCSDRMSYNMPGMAFPNRPVSQHYMQPGGIEGDGTGYGTGAGNYSQDKSNMMSRQFYNQGVPCPTDNQQSYRQQYPGSTQQSYQYQQQQTSTNVPTQYQAMSGSGTGMPSTGMPSSGMQSSGMQSSGMPSSGMQSSGMPANNMSSNSPRHNYSGSGQITGAPTVGQSNMRQSHPHLRNAGLNPQDIANNILHMASSTYPTNHTVQVPLSQNRSTPYHVPSRSPHYNPQQQMPQDTGNYNPMCTDYAQQSHGQQQSHGPPQTHGQQQSHGQMQSHGQQQSQNQFVYPTNSQMKQQSSQQRDIRMSPVSPASAAMMASPHSQHSAHSMQSSSPCSMHSPGIGGSVRSPLPDMHADQRRAMTGGHPHSQMMNSPQRQQPQQCMVPTSPAGNTGQRMVPPTQQLQVSVPSPAAQQYGYRDNLQPGMAQQYTSPQSHHSGHSSQFSPNIQTNSPCSQYGNMSPYTPATSHTSYNTSLHQQQSSNHFVTDSAPKVDTGTKQGLSNPLQSLQKLCMLPDRKVVDPKTVVKETCVQYTNENVSKTSNTGPMATNEHQDIGADTRGRSVDCNTGISKSHTPDMDTDRALHHGSELLDSSMDDKEKYPADNEIRCQPKKARLMRAVQDDFEASNVATSIHGTTSAIPSQPSYTDSHTNTTDQSHLPSTNEHVVYSSCSDNTNTGMCEASMSNAADSTQQLQIQSEIVTSNQLGDIYANVNNQEPESSALVEKTVSEQVLNSQGIIDSGTKSEQIITDINFETIDNEISSSQIEHDLGASTESNVQLLDDQIVNSLKLTKDVQSNSIQPNSVVMSDTAVSDCESQLVVKKDIPSSYSRNDQIKRVEKSSRLRVGSTGSLSDSHDISDYEYDHIGCDDVEMDNYISDDNCAPATIHMDATDKHTGNDDIGITDSVVISNPYRKKSTIRLPHSTNGANDCSRDFNDLCYSNKRRSRAFTRMNIGHVASDSDGDYIVPSPLAADVVDGAVGVENGDGTMTVVNTGRVRPRKTPVKYKDTSFFQGDFVFIEEEEAYEQQNRPKKNVSKKVIAMDVNHNSRDNGHHGKQGVKRKPTNTKPQVQKQKRQRVANTNLNNVRVTTKQPKETNLKDALIMEAKDSKKVIKVKGPVKDDTEKDSGLENSDNDAKKRLNEDIPETAAATKAASITFGATTAVHTRRSARANPKRLSNVTENNNKNNMNGVKTEPNQTSVTSSEDCKPQQAPSSRSKGKRCAVKLEKWDTPVVKSEDVKAEVIEIESDSNDDNSKKGSDAAMAIELDSNRDDQDSVKLGELDLSDNERFHDFKFSLIEDDSVPSIADDGVIHLQTDFKQEEPIVKEKKVKKPAISSRRKASTSNKSAVVKKKDSRSRRRKQQHIEDLDPDFDLQPMKNSLKSMKAQDAESKKRKLKKDKWANFKGPKVMLEGVKETPERCYVINDPFEQIGAKKAKSVAQNVTRIEVSHLPSDKSVLIPNTDNTESEKWTCALCGKHSSYKFLGDLFGPYSVETMSEDMLDLSPRMSLASGRKRKSEDGQPSTSKGGRTGKRATSLSKEMSEWKEVWVHESCAVYSDGVFLIGNKIYGLQEAVRIASQTPCSKCHEMGAMIGCLNKGCHQKFHFVCAQESDCYLDEENFSLLCPKHKVKKLMQLNASTSGVS